MTQPIGNPNMPMLVMAANPGQAPPQPVQPIQQPQVMPGQAQVMPGQTQMMPGQAQVMPGQTQSGVTLIPMGPQPLQQYQYYGGGQVPQFQPTFVLQATGGTPMADRTQYVVQQPVQYYQQPQYIVAPGQQALPPNQQPALMTAGGQQLVAVNTTTPAYMPANQLQYVPANPLQYSQQRPLSPPPCIVSKSLWNSQGGAQPAVPLSPRYLNIKPDREAVLMSPKPKDQSTMLASPRSPSRLPFADLEIKETDECVTKETEKEEQNPKARELEVSDWLPEEKENNPVVEEKKPESDEEMVPISLKNNYDHLEYNPELELKYFGDDFLRDKGRRRTNRRVQEYLRDRPFVQPAPPTPMYAVYQLRKKNWDRKLRQHAKERPAQRGFRNLSDLLGSMNSDTFTRMNEAEYRDSHRHGWSKSYPRMASMRSSSDSDSDIEDDVFDQDEPTRQDRLQSFGFATPNRQVVQSTPDASPVEESQTSAMSSECLKDSAFSEESTPEGPDRSDQHSSKDAKQDHESTSITSNPKMKRTKSGKNIWALIEKEGKEKQKRIEEFDKQNTRYGKQKDVTKQAKDNPNKRTSKSPVYPTCGAKRKKFTSPKSRKGKGPLRRPGKRHSNRQTPHTPAPADDWLARAAFLASSGFKDRSGGRRRINSRNL